ncbi:ABC transporter substrate-binding protein [Camelimonas abortus]|uniref:ABC transporter substrate-binding protein n=1 Tax=Camelimonas abortus TaxID=1017184 RepID=UPI0035EA71C5
MTNNDRTFTPSRRQMLRGLGLAAAAGVTPGLLAAPAIARGKYDEGASDTEIRLGQTAPYSGPASYLGVMARAEVAYFERLNRSGGVRGRKVRIISLDDAYSPPKTVEATRRLVESDGVLAMVGSIGTATQTAVQRYLNGKKIPQLLVGSGASRFNQPDRFPWTTPGSGVYAVEGETLGRYLAAGKPDAKVVILSQADELGRDYVSGFRKGLGARAAQMLVKEAVYEAADPTVDSQIVQLASTGADVFINLTIGKFLSQSVRKAHELGWKPEQYLLSGAATVSLLKPAGTAATNGLLAPRSIRSVSSPQWADDPGVKDYQALRAEFLPNVDPTDNAGFSGYSVGVLIHQILEKCGDDLTRENLLRAATDLRGMTSPMNLPGITFATSPTDYALYKNYELSRYENDDWVRVKTLSAG